MKKYISILILVFSVNCLIAQNDTIFCLTPPPEVDSCVFDIQKKYEITFRFGTIEDVAKNYKLISDLEVKFGKSFTKTLIKEHSCSSDWKKYLRSLHGNRKGQVASTRYKVKFRSFGRVKSYASESLNGTPDIWTEVIRNIKFDAEGNKTKDEKTEAKINLM